MNSTVTELSPAEKAETVATLMVDDKAAAAMLRTTGQYTNVDCPHCGASVGNRCYRVQERTRVDRMMNVITSVEFVKTGPHAGRIRAAVADLRAILAAEAAADAAALDQAV